MNSFLGPTLYAIYIPALALAVYRALLFFTSDVLGVRVTGSRRLAALLSVAISMGICSFVTVWWVFKLLLVGLLASILYQVAAPRLRDNMEAVEVRVLLLASSVLGSYTILELFFGLWNRLVVRPL